MAGAQLEVHSALRPVLADLWDSGLPAAERRGLLRHAVWLACGGAAKARTVPERASDGVELGIVDAACQLTANALGTRKACIGQLAKLLKEDGEAGQDLARRLSRASKARRLRAHPDPLLLRDIELFLCSRSVQLASRSGGSEPEVTEVTCSLGSSAAECASEDTRGEVHGDREDGILYVLQRQVSELRVRVARLEEAGSWSGGSLAPEHPVAEAMDSYYMGEVCVDAAVQADLLLVQTAVMAGVEAGTQTDAALAAVETVLFKDEAVATDEASHEMGVITPGGRHGEELCEELCSLEQTYEEAEQVLVDEAGQVICRGGGGRHWSRGL